MATTNHVKTNHVTKNHVTSIHVTSINQSESISSAKHSYAAQKFVMTSAQQSQVTLKFVYDIGSREALVRSISFK